MITPFFKLISKIQIRSSIKTDGLNPKRITTILCFVKTFYEKPFSAIFMAANQKTMIIKTKILNYYSNKTLFVFDDLAQKRLNNTTFRVEIDESNE